MFNAPSSGGDTLPAKDLIGQLLIVRPTEHVQGIRTSFGEKDGIRADVVVLTATNPDGSYGVVHQSVLWLQGKLVGSLKRQIGELVLARMGVGTGKPGQNPPFELADATGDAQAVTFAEGWISAHPDFLTTVKAPAPAPAPVAAAAPAPIPTPAAVPVPAAVPAPVAQPAAIPAPAAVPVPAAAAAPAVLDPAVLAALDPEARAQLAAALGQH